MDFYAKRLVLAAIAASVCALGLFAAFDKYQDWQHLPVTVSDTNAASNVRVQYDFTKPVHGPWLLNPSSDSVSVFWITRMRCASAIEYRKKGEEQFKRIWKTAYGHPDDRSDIHSFHLEGLESGTTYEYRLLNSLTKYQSPYTGTVVGREIYSFKTLDDKTENYKVFITSDFHGSSRLNLDPLYERTGAKDASLYFFLGDNVEDNMIDARFYTTFGFLDDVTRLWGSEKQTVFVRGNHDASGNEATHWGDYFGRKDGKAYFTVRHGPVLFVILDIGRPTGSNAANEIWDGYMKEQVEWYANLKNSPEWKSARFRVAMGHYGTRVCGNDTKWFAQYFKEVLNDPSPAGRIHLFVAGHEHHYARNNPLTDKLSRPQPWSKNPMSEEALAKAIKRSFPMLADDFVFCEVTCRLVEGMTMDVTKDKLVVRSHDTSDDTGCLFDAFEVMPDGSVNDLPLE